METKLDVTVLAGRVISDVRVDPGRVVVNDIVLGGRVETIVVVACGRDTVVTSPGRVVVEITVSPGAVVTIVTVDGGMTEVLVIVEKIVDSEVEIDSEVLVTVLSRVLVTKEISTRVIMGPSTVCVGPGTVSTLVCTEICVEVGPGIVVGKNSVIVRSISLVIVSVMYDVKVTAGRVVTFPDTVMVVAGSVTVVTLYDVVVVVSVITRSVVR